MDEQQLMEENQRLKRELQELQEKREIELTDAERKLEKERLAGRNHQETAQDRGADLDGMRNRMVKLTRQLDDECSKRDQAMQESQNLERQLTDVGENDMAGSVPATGRSGKGVSFNAGESEGQAPAGNQASTKLMNVVGTWMRTKDLQQALLRHASINDMGFQTLVQVLYDCPSLQMLDLSQNQLTMDTCHHMCQLMTNRPNLSYISLEGNRFSMRSIGYFMTAIMERQNMKKLTPLDLLDLQNNEGMISAMAAPVSDGLLKQVTGALGRTRLPPRGAELVAQTMRALWQFLHATQHPQVKNTSPDEVAFHVMDKTTIRKMENALAKIMLLQSEDDASSKTASGVTSVTADLVFLSLLEAPGDAMTGGAAATAQSQASPHDRDGVALPPLDQRATPSGQERRAARTPLTGSAAKLDLRGDPFSDLKQAFEPPKDKLDTFNRKQIVTNNGTVLMNMLERLLETTKIDACDVETGQTLLEYACRTNNLSLAKLCYRRGSNLSQRTQQGDTCFNIVTHQKNYSLMEFLHMYGVKVNFADAHGSTALHKAAANDDVDAICRLLEWGADVNMRDGRLRMPLHIASAAGNTKVTMLLLEVGADLNAKDDREYTAVACAEAHAHFKLMDRLKQLGGKGHGLAQGQADLGASKSMTNFGKLPIGAQMMKSTSLGRIGKVRVSGLPQRSDTIKSGHLDMGMMPLIGLSGRWTAK